MDMKTKSAQQTNGTLLRTICLILSMVVKHTFQEVVRDNNALEANL